MSSLVEKLTAEGGGESAGFLNDIVTQLWPHINVAVGKMVKEIAEPMIESTLPGPLSSLHFTKLDLGQVPMKISNVLATKSETGGVKLDMNVDWAGKCDIQLDGTMIPTLVSSIPEFLHNATYMLQANAFNRESKVLHSMAGFAFYWAHCPIYFRW